MKFLVAAFSILVSACVNNAVNETPPEKLDLRAIEARQSVLRKHNSGLIHVASGVLVDGYQQARAGNCSRCPSISVSFGDFLNSAAVAPSYISDRRAASCSVDKESLDVVYLRAPKGSNSMELVEYVAPNLPLAERRYGDLVELSEKEPRTTVYSIESIYAYSQERWEKRTDKIE